MKPKPTIPRALKKLSVDKLTRLAFIYAEQDRRAFADSWPPGSKEALEAESVANQLRAYRQKRWGKTLGDRLDESPSSKIEIRGSHDFK